jgi:hypothetical protein
MADVREVAAFREKDDLIAYLQHTVGVSERQASGLAGVSDCDQWTANLAPDGQPADIRCVTMVHGWYLVVPVQPGPPVRGLAAQDAEFLNQLDPGLHRPGVTVTLPSGRRMSGGEVADWAAGDWVAGAEVPAT